jgi:hypothetical protein
MKQAAALVRAGTQRKRGARVAALCALAAVACDNPFFPPTGTPSATVKLRDTPQGVIDQLIISYESRRIDLFNDLLSPSGGYKFYVAKSYQTEYVQGGNHAHLLDVIDSARYHFVPRGDYYYWGYNEEIEKHKRIFSIIHSMRFDPRPVYKPDCAPGDTETCFVYTIEETVETLTVKTETGQRTVINEVFDTVAVEVPLIGGKLDITGRDPSTQYDFSYQVDLGMQVFYLVRDPADSLLWVIDKWFDLGGG